MEAHAYGALLTENDPIAKQPGKIKVALKPHQLASLQKAIIMEQNGETQYTIPVTPHWIENMHIGESVKIRTNVGVIGDIVGYGKTLTALSIIAATPVRKIHSISTMFNSMHKYGHHFIAESVIPEVINEKFINSTLVIVPRGPVLMQWKCALEKQTSLKFLVIDGIVSVRKNCPESNASNDDIIRYFSQFDVVLVKSTIVHGFLAYFTERPVSSIYVWSRVMVDEAHETLAGVPFIKNKFLWLISGTIDLLRTNKTWGLGSLAPLTEGGRMKYMTLRCETNFVKKSFDVPNMIEHAYNCELDRNIATVYDLVSPAVLDRINADDIKGVIELLGGSCETETNIVTLVTKNLLRDIHNKTNEISYVKSLEIPEQLRSNRLNTLEGELKSMNEKHKSLVERVSNLKSKICDICYCPMEKPIILTCTHSYCSGCIIDWMKRRGHVCPMCRAQIKLLAGVVDDDAGASTSTRTPKVQKGPLSKTDQVIDIVLNKPSGKFLVFTHFDNMFHDLKKRMTADNQITVSELKGSTATMMKILERFTEGDIRVLLIDSSKFAAGIDISMATDVIMVHAMKENGTQCIARAQRVGRTTPLHVHHLYYPHERPN